MPAGTLASSLRSLANPAYRSYFIGQLFSRTGTRVQDVAQGWYVLQETGSGSALGLLFTVEYLPMLLIGSFTGALADRIPRHRLMVIAQLSFAILAFVLCSATAVHAPIVFFYLIATLRGLLAAVDIPAGDAFVGDIVDAEHIRSAVSLNSFVFNTGRLIGPLIATATIALTGTAACFALNAISYLIFAFMLLSIHPSNRQRAELAKNVSIREGIRYVWGVLEIRAALVLMLSVSLFTYNAQTLFPLLSEKVLHGGVNTYAALLISYSLGFLPTVLFSASRAAPSNRQVVLGGWAAAVVFLTAAGLAGSGTLACCIGLAIFGSVNSIFHSQVTTTVQLHSAPQMKGRVMALWAMVLWGTSPFGAPAVGFVAQHTDPRWAMVMAATCTMIGAAYATYTLRHRLHERSPTKPDGKQSPEEQLIASRSLQDTDELAP